MWLQQGGGPACTTRRACAFVVVGFAVDSVNHDVLSVDISRCGGRYRSGLPSNHVWHKSLGVGQARGSSPGAGACHCAQWFLPLVLVPLSL